MLRVLANNHNAAFALNHFAFFADGLNGRSYFHFETTSLYSLKRVLFGTPGNASLG